MESLQSRWRSGPEASLHFGARGPAGGEKTEQLGCAFFLHRAARGAAPDRDCDRERHSRQPLICDRHVPRSVPYDGFSIGPLR